jgi:hypothetical protein
VSQYIKSIQQVSVALTSGTASGTATISSVNTANAIIIFDGIFCHAGSTTAYWMAVGRWTLTNSTTVTFNRDGTATGSNTLTTRATVVEFASDVNSIQSGSITITAGNTSNTATITSVGANAFVLWLGAETTAGSGGYSEAYGNSVELTNSTTVTARISVSTSQDIKVGYMVVDLTSNIVASVQHFATAQSSLTTATTTQTITSVNSNSAIAFYNGVTVGTATNGLANAAHRLELTNSTTLTWTRNGTGSLARTHYATVVEFQNGALNGSIQRNTIAGDGTSTSITATVTSVSTTMSFVVWSGFSCANTTSVAAFANLRLTNSTTLTLQFDGVSNSSQTTPYQVIQFDNTAPAIPKPCIVAQAIYRATVW